MSRSLKLIERSDFYNGQSGEEAVTLGSAQPCLDTFSFSISREVARTGFM